MFIQKQSIQNLIERISLVDHLKRYIELKRSGSNWIGICPFHQDTTPSFYVYPTNYHCFACNAHGSVLDYELHRSGLSFKECVEQLASSYQYTLSFESNETEEKNKNLLIKKNAQIEVLKKILKMSSTLDLSLQHDNNFNSLYFSSEKLIHQIFESEFYKHYSIHPLYKENNEIYGVVYSSKFENNINTQNDFLTTLYITINQNFTPCLNWNEARPYAIKEKQLIVTFDLFTFNLLKNKNIENIVVCFDKINIYLLKIFSKRIKNLIYILPDNDKSKLFLWNSFKNSIEQEDISIEVIMIPENKNNRMLFFKPMNEEKLKKLFNNAEKIHIKITEQYIDSQAKNDNKIDSFKKIILPIINKIKEASTKNALLVDISNRFFYGVHLASSGLSPVVKPRDEIIKPEEKTTKLIPQQEILQNELNIELINLMTRTVEFYHKYLLQSKTLNGAEIKYLESRGLNLNQIKRWKIGYCSPHSDLSKKANSGIVSEDNLNRLGVIKKTKSGNKYYDFFYDRIVIPICNHQGKFVGLTGRIISSNNQNQQFNQVPKYINSFESEIFNKSKILFNFYKAIESIIINKYVIVVEGHMDCITLVNAGIENVVAVMGTALTQFHIEELSRLTKRIIICFDNDKAGQSAAKRTFSAAVNFEDLDVEYLMLSDCKDPDEYIKKFGQNQFLNLVKNKNTLLYEQICAWSYASSEDYQEFTFQIQEEFQCLIHSNNTNLKKQVENYIFEKYNINLKSFFNKSNLNETNSTKKINGINSQQNESNIDWKVTNPLEIKLLLSLIYLKFTELPQILQNIMLGNSSEKESDQQICAQAIENQFSKAGFKVFLEISSWMLENPNISAAYKGFDTFVDFSKESKILIGFALSNIKILMEFYLQDLLKDNLSTHISMVSSNTMWTIKNAGFLKFHHRNIKLAFQNGVLPSLFAEALLNLEVDYIDSALKAQSSLHFDNDLDLQFQFLVSERVRCKIELGKIGGI